MLTLESACSFPVNSENCNENNISSQAQVSNSRKQNSLNIIFKCEDPVFHCIDCLKDMRLILYRFLKKIDYQDKMNNHNLLTFLYSPVECVDINIIVPLIG